MRREIVSLWHESRAIVDGVLDLTDWNMHCWTHTQDSPELTSQHNDMSMTGINTSSCPDKPHAQHVPRSENRTSAGNKFGASQASIQRRFMKRLTTPCTQVSGRIRFPSRCLSAPRSGFVHWCGTLTPVRPLQTGFGRLGQITICLGISFPLPRTSPWSPHTPPSNPPAD